MNKNKNSKTLRICGLDEVGRGAFAGPLVAAALILPFSIHTLQKTVSYTICDSKLMKEKDREHLYEKILTLDIPFITEFIHIEDINAKGIGWANIKIFKTLISKIEADTYIVDGKLKIRMDDKPTIHIRSVVDADATIPEVILAGIIAKVTRDRFMKKLHLKYPEYLWNKNKGYGTQEHREAIMQNGITPYHRSAYIHFT